MQTATANTLTQPADAEELWIHVVPKGELRNTEAGIVQVLDDVALNSIVAGIEGDKLRLGNRWPGIYGGREHHVYDADQDSEALAWFKDFEKREDGIWANARGLTDIGREAVQNGRYKFTSFVADRRNTEDLGNGRHRILKIETIGFTNQANGKELLTPITNRSPSLVFNVESLTPKEAGDKFTALVKQTQRERGWDHAAAWNYCRLQENKLYNRMCGRTETPRQPEAPRRTPANDGQDKFCTYAGEALRLLAEKDQRAFNCSFHDSWQRVCNRRQDLFRLSNRDAKMDVWSELEIAAWDKFNSARRLQPDGKLLQVGEKTVEYFHRDFEGISRREPELSPREVWDRIKEIYPGTFWPFVAVTAK